MEKLQQDDKLSFRNLSMFSLGTVGRDFLYAFFNGYLLSYILFTKHLTSSQFASISIIIICARIFDALNDPIMGGIVENTRTKFGKYKPWQVIGAVLSSVVVVAVFITNLDGWSFIAYLAVCYFLFSITFTMNDISYWGMLPSLTSNAHDRNKLTSFAQICAGIGSGLVGLLVPALTAGNLALKGGAVSGYKLIAIAAGILMVGFQLFTIFGVKEKPVEIKAEKSEKLDIKHMFKVIFKNDQLMWTALVMLIFNIGTNVVGGGLSMTYLYFEFGYKGILLTLFGIGFSVLSTAFTFFFPWLSKKFGRDKLLYSAGISIIIGYLLMLIVALAIPTGAEKSTVWYAKFVGMAAANMFVGYGTGFYMIMVVNIANTVEYNEWKTGKREEGLIFSLRPLTAKMGSALMQGLVMIVYLVAGVLTYTNGISSLENAQAAGTITEAEKLTEINNIIASVSTQSKIILITCMCMIPVVFMAVAMLIYKKKCFLNEEMLEKMKKEIEERNQSIENIENEQTNGN